MGFKSKMRTSLVIPLLAAAAVRGANDWKVKCSGACEWETNSAPGQPFATVAIDGPSRVVSDITPAASWEILDCPANWDAGSREVRLVCTADDPAAGGCDDLLEDGAVDTIVRLPASCGTGPFARVAVWGVSGDQSIPEGSVAQRKLKLRKRAEPAQVMQATLDWDLKAIPEQRGTVTIDVRGGSLPSTGATASRMRNKMKRQFGFLDDIGNAIGDAADSVGDFVGDAVDTVEEVATDVGEAIGDTAQDVVDGAQEAVENVGEFVGDAADTVGDAVGDAVDAVGDFVEDVNNVDINDSTSTNINIVDTFQLLTTSLTCSAGPASFDATVTVSVDVDVQANIGFAFLMKATVAPPDVQDFAIAGVMSGRAKAVFNIEAFLAGDIDSGFLPIVNLGIPGLSIPGVFNLGPQVAINARAFATLDFATSMTIPTTWNFPLIDFALPDSKGTAEAESEESKNTSDIQFSMNPGELNGQIEAHIIPGLEFGIDVLNGFVAGAEVFMRADADATLKLEATVNPDFSMDGCTDLSVGINVNAGATASFLSFFNEQTSITIFQKRAEIFKRCFGAGDGPATAIFDNGDGTFTNALGDLVNENGELIDEAGNVIPDSEALPIGEEGAAAEDPNAPVLDEAGNPIPEEDLIFDNGDGTFEDAAGNPTNEFGQRIDSLGGLLACELDLTGAVDEDGTPIAPEDVIVENSDGTFSNGNCDIVNAEGQKVDAAGNVIDFEPVLDENGVEIPPEDIIIDNGDGTFSDINGNPVDEFGGAIDIDAEGNVIPVELEPFPEDVAPVEDVEQIEEEPLITEDPELVIKTEDEVKQIAIDLVNGVFAPQRRFAARSSVPPKPVVAKRNSTKPNTEMKKRQGGLACFPSVSGPGIPPIPTSPLDLARFF